MWAYEGRHKGNLMTIRISHCTVIPNMKHCFAHLTQAYSEAQNAVLPKLGKEVFAKQ